MLFRWMQNNAFWGLLCLSALATMDLGHTASTKRGVGSTKKGVGMSSLYYNCNDVEQFTNIAWWYSWGISTAFHSDRDHMCSNELQQKDKYIPMCWGYWPQPPTKKEFNFLAPSSDINKHVLGFYEPNHMRQAFMKPAEAADRWRELEAAGKANGATKFVSPAAAPGGIYDHFQWFDEFFQSCSDCQIDYISTHCYYEKPTEVMDYLKSLWERYNKKIFLTEFALPHTDDEDKQLAYMKELLPMLEDAEYVEKYAWFASRKGTGTGYVKSSCSLLDHKLTTDGKYESKLTPLGEYYNNF
ncbi:uncharacterized protein [Amphiura filiformis]|uniref:uncharacterized protein n=1 Tax=Amphiura filiformis TaxID=82378 RepID=UPI003B2113AF